MPWSEHLIAGPVLLPLATAAVMLLLGEGRRELKALLNVVSTLLGLAMAVTLLLRVQADGPAAFGVYLPGNWSVPYGIVLVADRLSALMAVLAGSVALAALLFALARWQRAGVYFHTLFQLQLMGLYGAFLTADLFNLFVFFEVLLAASYGLLLHGSGPERVRAGLHYIAINLVASLLFLIGVAVLYGVTGTLNMADIAHKLTLVPVSDRGLLHAGAAILAIAFLAKAALWPLNFWLPPAYAAASAPAAAVFAILTKVGVYAVLRLWTLCFPAEAGDSAGFGDRVLVWGGIATLAYGAIGMMASHQLSRLAGYSVIASSGTLIAAVGFDAPALGGAALYYLDQLHAGRLRAVPAGRTAGARTPGGDRPAAARRRQRRAARLHRRRTDGRHQPRRRRGGADRPRHPGRAGLPGGGLHPLRDGGVGVAAAGRLRRQAGHAGRAAGTPGRGLVDAVRAAAGLGPGRGDRAASRGHAPFLDHAGPSCAAPARGRDAADRRAAGGHGGAGGAGRRGAGLHPRHRRHAARADPLHAGRHVGASVAAADAGGGALKLLQRVLPSPWLSLGLFGGWLLLARSTSAGQIVLALAVAVAAPLLMAPLRPRPGPLRRCGLLLRLILRVGVEVVRSAIEVARGVVRARSRPPRGRFVVVPLELRDEHALAALAMITAVIPGTVWAELAPDRSALLMHVFDLDDEDGFVAHFKRDYEHPLKEIFE